jgi:hypothetical protein
MDESPVTTPPAKAAAPARKPAVKKPAKRVVEKGEQRAYMQATLPADARPVDRVAYDVLMQRSDLLPSVERILNGSPDEATAERALVLFQQALSGVDDPNRNPQTAIAAAIAGQGAA